MYFEFDYWMYKVLDLDPEEGKPWPFSPKDNWWCHYPAERRGIHI